MNLPLARVVDRWLGVPICLALSFGELLRPRRIPQQPQRVLVVLLSEMGSLVLAQPMLSRLRELYPPEELHVLLFEKNRQVLDLLEEVPDENVITISDRSFPELVRGSFAALRSFQRKPFDIVIDCDLFTRISSIMSYLSGASVRAGFHPHTQEGLYRGSFINRPVLYNPYRHIAEQFMTLVSAISSSTVPKAKGPVAACQPPPFARFAPGDIEKSHQQLHVDYPEVAGKKLVLVNPSGGMLPIRAWPLESYFKVCKALLDDGYAVGVIGLPGDKPYGRAIVEHCQSPQCLDLTGYTGSVRHLVALFHRAHLLISNDSGPAQIAALSPLPVIVLFGPETPALYGPLNRKACCLFSAFACSPCLSAYNHRESPCDGDNQCLKQIAPDRVLAKAREMLSGGRTVDTRSLV